ncbi:hypothetical protein HOD83_02610 [Candidatus Woesearchaeota archaeon]|jgi:hypothetical protein|nr:hypothetical protein [Candidatus Woesearchaeota archaeon]MBT4114315.1 hypothetical protein [Candidatus Woesearchaeota archaeon]MBT4248459.1 hypothetical protein [Candidatus Woesearchaeota archaeon]
MQRKGQSNVVYMNYFILLGLVFLSFVFIFSNNFSRESSDQIKEEIADSIFARLEKGLFELKAIGNQTDDVAPIKIIEIPHRLGDNHYNLFGDNNEIIIQSAGQSAFYKAKTVYWNEVNFTGSTDSQDAEIRLLYNTSTNQIVIS